MITPKKGLPLTVSCPDCQSKPGHACTVPTSTKRRNVGWYHAARRDAADAVIEPPKLSPVEKLAERLLSGLDPAVYEFACECGEACPADGYTSVADVKTLLEHAAFDHVSRRDVFVHRSMKLASGYELGVLLELDTQTDAEQAWRDSR